MGKRTSPTVRRRRLAIELRRLRAENGIKAADVAKELGYSPGKISQMETARVSISVPDARAMLEMYGVNGDQRDTLVDLARTSRKRGWWQAYNDTLHQWFQFYVGLETETSELRSYQAEYVPGLLQTGDYQRALLAVELKKWSDEEVDQLVALRKDRQQLLGCEDTPRLSIILNEGALRRLVGTPQVMHGQLRRLLDAGREEHITIQVLPFAAGAHVVMVCSFMLLSFPEPADTDVVYLENIAGAHYLEEREDVQRYRLAF